MGLQAFGQKRCSRAMIPEDSAGFPLPSRPKLSCNFDTCESPKNIINCHSVVFVSHDVTEKLPRVRYAIGASGLELS